MSDAFGVMVLGLLALVAYFLPTIVAYYREHGYVGVVFALNLFGGVTGVLWLVAFAWACFPKEKSLVDPVLGNVTGTGVRNAGDTLGGAGFGVLRGFESEKNMAGEADRADETKMISETSQVANASVTSELKAAAELHSQGILSDEEFQALKARILN